MRKITFLVGAGAGFVLGSRAGRGPYEQLETRVRSIVNRPDVQDAAGQVKSAVKEQVKAVPDKVSDKLPTSHSDSTDDAVVPDDLVMPDDAVMPDEVIVLEEVVVVADPAEDSVSDPI